MSTLEVDKLTAGFLVDGNESIVLQNICLSVSSGETLAIVGESGSGKSVTSMHIMQLLDKRSAFIREGRISFGSKVISENPDLGKVRGGQIAMIFQEPMTALNPTMSCGKQVSEMLRLHENLSKADAKTRVLDLFTLVEIPDPDRAYGSYPHELSGGQKQRVVIAMAISCNPSFLIADEPTTALDVTVQAAILQLLKKLQVDKGMGMIFITHDLAVVADIADHVCVMYRGEIVETGEARAVLQSPQHSYTKGLLACRPPLHTRPHRLPTVGSVMNNETVDSHLEAPEDRRKRLESLDSQAAVMEVKNLTKDFSSSGLFSKGKISVRAVDDVSFTIRKGETFGLVGESGCGKTTLSRMLVGLIAASSGSVTYGKKSLEDLVAEKRGALARVVQIIFQDPYSSLNPRLTIGEAIMEPMKVHKTVEGSEARKQRAAELLKLVGLDESAMSRYPHEFSGGQRQRIGIARALAVEPQILLCDESVSALDVSVQAQILNLLNDLKEQLGLSLLFISHDLSVVKYMSDRIMVMNKGRIEEIGEADSLFGNPTREYTQKLIHAIPGQALL
jgi:peptide/nickel transport system ATP-binding protein